MSFKRGKRRPANRRIVDAGDSEAGPTSSGNADVSDDDATVGSILRETMELQKCRERHTGVTSDQLASITEKAVEVKDTDDPFGLNKGGGLVSNKKRDEDAMGDFAESTEQMDDDNMMRKFVETQMAKRYGKVTEGSENMNDFKQNVPIDLQREVFAVEEKYQKKAVDDEDAERNAEALSGALLTSVPEIDLGIQERLKTIEATEDARRAVAGQRERRHRQTEQYRFKSFRPMSEAMGRRSERKGPPREGGGQGRGDKRDDRSTDMQTMRRYRNYVQTLRR